VDKNDLLPKQFSQELKKALGSHLKSVTLFGSRARGDSKIDSDYDFLILVDERNRKIVDEVREVEVEFLNTFGNLLGSLIYSEQEWEKRRNFPIAMNIRREGIRV
jgi:predicted nucleotidyltransferase